MAPFASRVIVNESVRSGCSDQELAVQSAISEALLGSVPAERSDDVILVQIAQETNSLIDEYTIMTQAPPPSRSPTQVVGEEGSQAESEAVHRLADFARFRIGKRKESLNLDHSHSHSHSSSSHGGRRSPPIVIPVLIEKSESNAMENKVVRSQSHSQTNPTATAAGMGLDRRRSIGLTRQRAQHGEHGNFQEKLQAAMRKGNSSEIPEALEMVQLARPPVVTVKEENVNAINKNNVNSKVITVSVVHSARPSSIREIQYKERDRRNSVDSLNNDEEVSLLKLKD